MKGLLYRLEGGGKYYIGSTTSTIKDRLKKHRSKSNEAIAKNREVYTYFKSIGWENITAILIDEFEIISKSELLAKECEVVKKHINDEKCLNRNLPVVTVEEKKIRDREYNKSRRLTNPDRERERLRQWRIDNPDKWKEQYSRYNKKKSQVQNTRGNS